MIKNIILFIAIISLHSCSCETKQPITKKQSLARTTEDNLPKILLSNNLQENTELTYGYELYANKIKLVQETHYTCSSIKNDSIHFDVKINSMHIEDGSDAQAQINKRTTEFENSLFNFSMNNHGQILDKLTYSETGKDGTTVLDVKYYFLDYPKDPIAVGSNWNVRRELTEKLFEAVDYNYQLIEINDGEARIQINGIYATKSETISKSISGDYIVDAETGEVISAKLSTSGSNGAGESVSAIIINRIDR